MAKQNYCRECNAALLPGSTDCKSCGWRDVSSGTASNPRPSLAELKIDMRSILDAARMEHPAHALPTNGDQAVEWFLNLIEPEHRTERPKEQSSRKKDGGTWLWPYAERVKYLLRIYLAAPRELQQVVVAARDDNIFWRGDDYPFFISVIDETEKMRELGFVEYRRQARAAMGRLNLEAAR